MLKKIYPSIWSAPPFPCSVLDQSHWPSLVTWTVLVLRFDTRWCRVSLARLKLGQFFTNNKFRTPRFLLCVSLHLLYNCISACLLINFSLTSNLQDIYNSRYESSFLNYTRFRIFRKKTQDHNVSLKLLSFLYKYLTPRTRRMRVMYLILPSCIFKSLR